MASHTKRESVNSKIPITQSISHLTLGIMPGITLGGALIDTIHTMVTTLGCMVGETLGM